jgi:hypothetical protein
MRIKISKLQNIFLFCCFVIFCLNFKIKFKKKSLIKINHNFDLVQNSSEPILCMVITFMNPKNDVWKAFANANTAKMYYDFKKYIVSYLAISHQEVNGLDTWLAAGNNLFLNQTEYNEYKTPKFKSIFKQMEDVCPSEVFFVGYANADIMFDENLIKTLQSIKNWTIKYKKSLLIVGQRLNFLLKGRLNVHDIKSLNAQIFQNNAQDFFITTRNFFDWSLIPDFVIGRSAYDNALVDWAYHKNSLMDVTETVKALHQTVSDGNWAGRNDHPDREYNLNLPGATWDHAKTTYAHYKTVFQNQQICVINTSNEIL